VLVTNLSALIVEKCNKLAATSSSHQTCSDYLWQSMVTIFHFGNTI